MQSPEPRGDAASHLSHAALQRLLQVGSEVVSELDHETVLQRVLEAARDLTGARYAALGVLDADRSGLERFLTAGIDEPTQRAIGDLPRGRGVLGVLITDPRPLRLADVGVHPASYGFPIDHPPMRSFLGVPILVRGEAWGNLYLTEKAGGEFDEADEEAIVILARWAATAIDNARLYRQEHAHRAELERAVRALETTSAITRALGTETDLDRVLELVVKRGRALVEARSMVLLLAERDQLVGRATAGEVGDAVIDLHLPVDDSVVGHVFRSGRTERLSDLAHQLRFRLGEHLQATAGLIVPMVFRSRSVGVLAAFDRLHDGPEFSAEDGMLMEAFAAAAATAVAGAQNVAAQTRQRGIEASESERARWARELHDETLQELGALKLALGAASRLDDIAAVRRALAGASEQVATGITQLRHLITELRPAALDELGVGPALEALAERVGTVNDVRVAMTIDLDYESGREQARLGPVLETTVYRLVQEALTNTVKHAGATQVEVDVVEIDDQVQVTITDDGAGFDPDAAAEGFGLLGMRERVALMEGTLTVESEKGKGTTIRCRLPVRRAAPSLRSVQPRAG
ncbi:MAG TPA: GAF domain-containing sensor histidine kinase [Solirubrobacteraceae bacterium]|nr:GAF domain-containing sensor histidine kinase [Solirubrobacteraceae bacterium]